MGARHGVGPGASLATPFWLTLPSAHPAVHPFSALSLLSSPALSPSLWLPGWDSPPPTPSETRHQKTPDSASWWC